MNSDITIARPYTTAAFEAAKAENQLCEWSTALKNLSIAVKNKAMAAAIKDPNVSKKQLCDLLIDFAPQKNMTNFIKVLSEKNRLSLLPSISHLFDIARAKESGYLSLTVTTASLLNDAEKTTLTEKLTRELQSKLKIDFTVDENIMGGTLIRSEDWVIDDTITGKLKRLETALVEGR